MVRTIRGNCWQRIADIKERSLKNKLMSCVMEMCRSDKALLRNVAGFLNRGIQFSFFMGVVE